MSLRLIENEPPAEPDDAHEATLAESQVVEGEWKGGTDGPTFMCPGGPLEDDVCDDCGYIGRWEHRAVMTWYPMPGMARGPASVARDLAKGWPPRPDDEGYWCMAGHDERCPGCGDIERLDFDRNVVSVKLSPSGRSKRAVVLREKADALETGAWLNPDDESVARFVDPQEAKPK